MEIKKSKKVEIESHRGTWLLMGFVTVLAVMFVTFEWAQYDKKIDTSMAVKDLIYDLDMVPITIPEKPLPPPEPVQPSQDEFRLIDNESSTEEGTVVGTEITTSPIILPPPTLIEEPVPVETEIVVFAEVMPEFKGGQKALNDFLSKNLKYPAVPQENGIEGKVIVQFVVDKNGTITGAEVVRGVHPQLDREALRVINLMPAWNPGKQSGRLVRVKYTVPVVFKLQ